MSRYFAVASLFLLCLSPAAAAPSATAPPPVAASVFAALPGAGTTVVSSDAALWQFAPRSLSEETPLTHTFLLRSTAQKTLVIERIAASCECIRAQIGETAALPVRIAPGQTVPVRVTLTPGRLVSGPVSKSVWIYLRGGSAEGLRLEMRGMIRGESDEKTKSNPKRNSQ